MASDWEWSYSFYRAALYRRGKVYRAALYRRGKVFCTASPDGNRALSPHDALILVDNLNGMQGGCTGNDLLDRINKVINEETFEMALEREGVDIAEFQSEWAGIKDDKGRSYIFGWLGSWIKAVLSAEHRQAQVRFGGKG